MEKSPKDMLFLENHPQMEGIMRVDRNHVIVDREDWELIRKVIINNDFIMSVLLKEIGDTNGKRLKR